MNKDSEFSPQDKKVHVACLEVPEYQSKKLFTRNKQQKVQDVTIIPHCSFSIEKKRLDFRPGLLFFDGIEASRSRGSHDTSFQHIDQLFLIPHSTMHVYISSLFFKVFSTLPYHLQHFLHYKFGFHFFIHTHSQSTAEIIQHPNSIYQLHNLYEYLKTLDISIFTFILIYSVSAHPAQDITK